MKNKTTAGILALIFGGIGIHRFYLNQGGLGIMYILLLWFFGISILLGFIDAISFFTMSEEEFDFRYNNPERFGNKRRPGTRREYRDYHRSQQDRYQYDNRKKTRQRPAARRNPSQSPKRSNLRNVEPPSFNKKNPYKQSGVKKYKEYDYEAAIEDFVKGLEINPNDISLHFNIACAYSLTERADKSMFHIGRAVELGFNDFEKIKTHDALAFVRIQPEWEEFEAQGYSNVKKLDAPKEDLLDKDMLLEQLKKLVELREKGLLTEKEFLEEKQKLLG